jgi:hypothetical protein
MISIVIKRLHTFTEERRFEASRPAARPLRRLAVAAIVNNPYAGRYVEDLKPMIDASVAIGRTMAEVTIQSFGKDVIESYGKGGIVGLAGEQEHANATHDSLC